MWAAVIHFLSKYRFHNNWTMLCQYRSTGSLNYIDKHGKQFVWARLVGYRFIALW